MSKTQQKIAIFDLDKTVTNTVDQLHNVCANLGYEKESSDIITNDPSIEGLKRRIDLLKGSKLSTIYEIVSKNPDVRLGATELFQYLKKNNYVLVLATGSPKPVAQYYMDRFGIDYCVCPEIMIDNGVVLGSEDIDDNFKLNGILKLVNEHGWNYEDMIYFDDALHGKNLMSKVKIGFAVDPKVEMPFASYTIKTLDQAIPFLKKHYF